MQAIFDNYFLTKKCIFSLSFTQFHWICFQGYNWKYVVIGSGNGMVPNRRQAITWANDVMIHKLMCVLVGLIETTHFGKSFWTNTSEHNFIAFKVLKGVYVIYLNIFIYIHMFFFAGNHLSIVIHWLTHFRIVFALQTIWMKNERSNEKSYLLSCRKQVLIKMRFWISNYLFSLVQINSFRPTQNDRQFPNGSSHSFLSMKIVAVWFKFHWNKFPGFIWQ